MDVNNQLSEQNVKRGYELVMDASRNLSDEGYRISRTNDETVVNAVAVTVELATGKVFYTYAN